MSTDFEVVHCSTSMEAATGAAPPTEFRIFKAGLNETSKGPFLFDEQAAADVMAHFQREGVDLIVDLEHLSLDRDSVNYDPDARAHFKLAVRDGELWACSVAWSPDGVRRLTEKTQKYISPVAMRDKATKRVTQIANVALVAQPATYDAPALVAASKDPRVAYARAACNALIALNRSGKKMSPELLKKILAAIEGGEDKSGILAEIVAAMAGGGEPAAPAGADPLAASAEPAAPAPGAEPKPAELSALTKALGCKSDEEAAAMVLTLHKQVTAQAAANDAVELETRRGLIAELVALGAEFPAHAWFGKPEDRVPVKRLAVEPIADMRARVALHKANPRTPAAPPVDATETLALSKDEQAYCTKHGLTAEQFNAKRAGSARSRK